MSSSVATAEIRLTENKDALSKLRRLAKTNVNGTCSFRKNAQGQEYYAAMFDGMTIPFYVGQVRSLPIAWAESLATIVMPIDEKCKQCKGEGSTIAGLCHVCKGVRWVDTNVERPLFKILSQTDGSIFDPNNYQSAPALDAPVMEAAKALTAS